MPDTTNSPITKFPVTGHPSPEGANFGGQEGDRITISKARYTEPSGGFAPGDEHTRRVEISGRAASAAPGFEVTLSTSLGFFSGGILRYGALPEDLIRTSEVESLISPYELSDSELDSALDQHLQAHGFSSSAMDCFQIALAHFNNVEAELDSRQHEHTHNLDTAPSNSTRSTARTNRIQEHDRQFNVKTTDADIKSLRGHARSLREAAGAVNAYLASLHTVVGVQKAAAQRHETIEQARADYAAPTTRISQDLSFVLRGGSENQIKASHNELFPDNPIGAVAPPQPNQPRQGT